MRPDTNESIVPTKRERELMVLIARGLQNKNIAHELNISENTVRAHIGNIMRKYHLHNRTQIAVIFALQGSTAQPRREVADARGYPHAAAERSFRSAPASRRSPPANARTK